ncbi:penicillin acylase family protein [Streptomyces sp. SID5473]|uniref:Penicillin acylase family protein n=1 Tax=Streptomyces tsukubensis (strain DSM 42081 / NBRC 108919 / NRRL 18488 / 9993) TaxID=1114943 RepID=A0A7G3ULN1_STRT9|nr:penicillin acylase family protein [Streptomyces sp. SID5473]MYS64989.1 penicillin acylase family protein [Streptomyces sp. SID5473]QKM71287.1 penicillin acylase family protein [Streptomyces tsukubensis NRRL18488]TAI40940.1 penicillin acylase family protein [Streptomyces tsukubensis]
MWNGRPGLRPAASVPTDPADDLGVPPVRPTTRQVLALTCLGALLVGAAGPVPGSRPAREVVGLPGLDRPVRVTVDTWGVSHIRAENSDDLFFAQGYTAARDRLFQIDTWRRDGLGELSEVLGSAYVAQDTASRLFLYRGDMQKEWESYPAGTREIATEFAAGINAYIDWLADNPAAMPQEFQKLGYRPARWKPEDLVRIRTHALGDNLRNELARAQITCADGIGGTKAFRKLEPARTPEVPAGLAPCDLPADVLATYDLATAGVTFPTGTTTPPSPAPAPAADPFAGAAGGSNAWALAPGRTASGRPVLAADPHRASSGAPANRYLVHLSAPGINVIGAGEPWNPGVSFGHNGHIAFGLTNMPVDQNDLYVYELHPDDPTRYRYRDGWESFRTVQEDVAVKGAAPARASLGFTRHGPVVKVDEAKKRAYAVRSVWTEPGTSPYLGSLAFQRAKNFSEFTRGLAAWKTPGSHLVYADARGDIGWVPVGMVPRRTGAGYDGLLPVPGDGRYEWDGFHSQDEMPRTLNPEQGYFATANEYNFPPGHPVTPAYEWHPRFRKERLDEVLSATRNATVQDSLNLQTDQKSLFATRLVPYLRTLASDDPDTRKALDVLRGFDGVIAEGSSGAALFEIWSMAVLRPAWLKKVAPRSAGNPWYFAVPEAGLMLESFADPDRWFGPGGAAVRDRLLLDTLPAAFRILAGARGPDPAAWRWGDLQTHTFRHPLGGTFGPVPRGGSYQTVQYSAYNLLNLQQMVGPVFRMAVDVGDWDASRAVNAPGQSGDPTSPHYGDLHRLWAGNGTFPLVYTPSAVERNARKHLVLLPAGRQPT